MKLIDDINANLLNKAGNINGAIIRRFWFQQSDLNKQILEATSFLPADVSYAERVFCIKQNITSLPTCPYSGQKLRFKSREQCYARVAGKENIYRIIDTPLKRQRHAATKKNTHKQRELNLLTTYKSQLYTLCSKEVVSEFVENRLKDSDLGRKCGILNDKHKDCNVNLLCSLLFYTEHPLLNTLTETIDWSERFYLFYHKKTPSEKDGKKIPYLTFTRGYYQPHEKISKFIPILFEAIDKQGFDVLYPPVSNNVTVFNKFTLACRKCNKTHIKTLATVSWKNIYCPGCFRDIGFSKAEKEVCELITKYSIPFEQNKTGIIPTGELDIYIPSKNLAIEFDGVLWHSFGTNYPPNAHLESKNKFRHLQKTIDCSIKNIQLLHIFDSEWKTKKQIVQSLILSKLGIFQKKVFARKCSISYLSEADKKQFLENNHLQGNCRSSYNFALFYENNPIAIMTFGKRAITGSSPKLELLRFATLINTQVIGGASKLFSHALKQLNPPLIISYANKRYSLGKLYQTLGFKLKHESAPSYWYTSDSTNLLHRSIFQKHKLQKSLGLDFDANLSESENMYKAGYRKIYDCGNYVFEYTP